jgi:type VI secretion system protein ImpK
MVALLALAFLTVVYAIFSITMSSASDKATSALLKLHGGGAPKIARAEPVEPLAPPPPSDIAEKVSVLLEKERAEGLVEVEDGSGFFVIRLMKDGMFRSGSAELDPSLKPLIERVAAELDQEAGPIRIVGHTDNIPMKKLFGAPYQDNFQLSEARARNVAVLFARSISDAKRLTAEGKADQEPRPSADNATEEGRARNRRIEIVLEAV